MKLSLFYPVAPVNVNQKFGLPDPKYTALGILAHNGIDLASVHGQPVYAAHAGTCYPEVDDSGGNGVVIRTLITFDYEGTQVHFKTIYWHLMKADAVVKMGQVVKPGDLIGYADNTGLSTGDHLHFGLKPQTWSEENWTWMNPAQNNGFKGAIDPAPYWNGYSAVDAQKLLTTMARLLVLLKEALKRGLYTK